MNATGKLPVPVDPSRIGLIIGKSGSTKSRIEETFGVRIEVDSEKGLVFVEPSEGATMYNVFRAKKAIEALALGFPVEDALLLADDMYDLDTIDLTEVSRNQSDLARIKARIIGSEGKFKKLLEETTGVKIVVGDKTVGLIGDYEQLKLAKEAISRLISGQSHQTVTKFLERERFALRRRRMQLWEKWNAI